MQNFVFVEVENTKMNQTLEQLSVKLSLLRKLRQANKFEHSQSHQDAYAQRKDHVRIQTAATCKLRREA